MSEETYNGWTNRETWAVALHINNDQGWQESVHEAIREFVKRNQADYEDNPESHDPEYVAASPHGAADVIRESVEEVLDFEDPSSRSFDRIQIAQEIGSLWRVNWTELGASFLSDFAELDD